MVYLLAVPGAALLLLSCVRPFQSVLRGSTRDALHRTVHSQLPWVSWAQSAKSSLVSTLVHASASTVTVEFFLLLIPMLLWTGHTALCLTLTVGLTFTTYLICAYKDILGSPRPGSLRATGQLASAHHSPIDASLSEVEFGAPSMHVGLTLCMVGVPTAYALTHPSPPAALPPAPLLLSLALAWTAWIAWGRLYLAVHTPIDLLLGALVGTSAVLTTALLAPPYFAWAATTDHPTLTHLLTSLLLLRLYPTPPEYTTSYLYATTFLGAWFGFVPFAAHALPLPPPSTLCPLLPPAAHAFLPPAALLPLKLVTGYALALTAKLVSKPLFTVLTSSTLDLLPSPLRNLLRTPLLAPPGRPAGPHSPDVVVFTKFSSYACVGLAVTSHHALFDRLALCLEPSSWQRLG